MIETNFATYENLEKKHIALIEHFINWKCGGNSYNHYLEIREYLKEQFPGETFSIMPYENKDKQRKLLITTKSL